MIVVSQIFHVCHKLGVMNTVVVALSTTAKRWNVVCSLVLSWVQFRATSGLWSKKVLVQEPTLIICWLVIRV